MNARNYRIDLKASPLDFQATSELMDSTVSFLSDVTIINKKMLLMIANIYVVRDVYSDKTHTVLTAQSIYEIPPNEIKSREDIYEFYKDALLALNEEYSEHQKQVIELPNRVFPTQPIETYQKEIDRVINLLNQRN